MPLSLQALRQSAAELLACAVCDLFPKTQLVDGASTEVGFYYDFVLNQPIDDHALVMLEERMRAIIYEDIPIQTLEMMRENASSYFHHHGQKLKAALVADMPANIVQIFKMGSFSDTCDGPYAAATKEIPAIKLQTLTQTNVYYPCLGTINVWRIHGTAFHESGAMKQFLKRAEKAKKRDHRQLGEEMQLFSFPEGSETCVWEYNGCVLRELLLDFWKSEHQGLKLHPLSTPRLVSTSLLKVPLTKEEERKRKAGQSPAITISIDDETFASCPDPTPLHARICSATTYSSRQLPIMYHECAQIGDNASSNQLCGLFKTRVYTSDITQIICTPEQVVQELISCLQFIAKMIKMFGFEHHWYLSTREQIPANSKSDWKIAMDCLVTAMKSCDFDYILDRQGYTPYGPKIEIGLTDALGQNWKGPYVAVNALFAENVDLHYIDEENRNAKPMMITRSLFGSLERFIGILIEHHSGALPLWLSPEQVRIIPIANRNAKYAETVHTEMNLAGFRSRIDYGTDTLGTKVHAAEKQKIPFIIIIGDKEEKNCVLTVRSCHSKSERNNVPLKLFMEQLHDDNQKDRNRVES
jgi:threonyl-tRNA synthetase